MHRCYVKTSAYPGYHVYDSAENINLGTTGKNENKVRWKCEL